MADAPTRGGGPLAVITRKVGPLPVWAYAAILVVAYFLYRRSHPSASSTPAGQPNSGGPTTGDQAYVPGFDAAGAGGGGGIGSVGTPSTVNNYYYGDLAAQQAGGGGTSAGGIAPPDRGGVMTPGGGITGRPIQAPGPITTPGIGYFGPGGGGVYYPPVVAPKMPTPSSPSFYGGPTPYRSGTMPFIAN